MHQYGFSPIRSQLLALSASASFINDDGMTDRQRRRQNEATTQPETETETEGLKHDLSNAAAVEDGPENPDMTGSVQVVAWTRLWGEDDGGDGDEAADKMYIDHWLQTHILGSIWQQAGWDRWKKTKKKGAKSDCI